MFLFAVYRESRSAMHGEQPQTLGHPQRLFQLFQLVIQRYSCMGALPILWRMVGLEE